MKHELRTEIHIDATSEVVWDVLTDLGRYGEWNPFIISSVGSPEVGERLVNRMEAPSGSAMTFKPQVTVVEEGKTFEWLGRLGVPGVFDGRHRFDIEGSPDGVTLIQSESFDGMLVRFMRKSLDTSTRAGFEAMNAALKTRAEAVPSN